jgi:hypothetical protein
MKTSTLTACVAGILWGTLILVLSMRIIQVHREFLLVGNCCPEWWRYVFGGIARRLDDPSFWATLSVAVSATLIHRAAEKVEKPGASTIVPTIKWLQMGAVFGSVFSAYLTAVYHRGGTFFFREMPTSIPHPRFTDPMIIGLQFFEGCLDTLLILAACFLLPVGLAMITNLHNQKSQAQDGNVSPDWFEPAAWLVDAAFKPVAVFVLLMTWGVVSPLFNRDSFLPWGLLKGLLGMLLLLWPFAILLLQAVSKLYDKRFMEARTFRIHWRYQGTNKVLQFLASVVSRIPFVPMLVIACRQDTQENK